jgi:hypothetical protein
MKAISTDPLLHWAFSLSTLAWCLNSTQPALAQTLSDQAIQQIQTTLNATGKIENGVLDIEIQRTDITQEVTSPSLVFPSDIRDIVFSPAFALNGHLFFQPLTDGKVFLNADVPLKEDEVNQFIFLLFNRGITWQGFHQKFLMNPQIWFVSFRTVGAPADIASVVKTGLNLTSIPFPQGPLASPTTPLDVNTLASYLHGQASIGEDGVLTIWVYRKSPVTIDNVTVNPQANISSNFQIKPRDTTGTSVDLVANFALTPAEIPGVAGLMLNGLRWFQGGLHNQETEESPQLYFDHMLKRGNVYELVTEIRRVLNMTDSE